MSDRGADDNDFGDQLVRLALMVLIASFLTVLFWGGYKLTAETRKDTPAPIDGR